ncbi:MAG: DegT/DnrJ/EryC1/StrS family aminotransferase, partial [Pseudobdellovibrionaceae bacterium]
MDKRLALFGGSPTLTEDHALHLRWPILEQDDFDAVQKVLSDGNISMHPIRMELEEAYKKYFGRQYGLSHCNGTSALLAAFFALDLKPGDEVLVTSATWWASVVPLFWLGAIPVFCENEDQQFGICTDDMAKKLTARTKAIVVVHLWGIPSQMEKILAFAKKHDLFIIEDASHAHGATLNDKK